MDLQPNLSRLLAPLTGQLPVLQRQDGFARSARLALWTTLLAGSGCATPGYGPYGPGYQGMYSAPPVFSPGGVPAGTTVPGTTTLPPQVNPGTYPGLPAYQTPPTGSNEPLPSGGTFQLPGGSQSSQRVPDYNEPTSMAPSASTPNQSVANNYGPTTIITAGGNRPTTTATATAPVETQFDAQPWPSLQPTPSSPPSPPPADNGFPVPPASGFPLPGTLESPPPADPFATSAITPPGGAFDPQASYLQPVKHEVERAAAMPMNPSAAATGAPPNALATAAGFEPSNLPASLFAYDGDHYRWLQGIVRKTAAGETRLTYSRFADEADPYQGDLTVVGHPLLQSLQDGDAVIVEGRLEISQLDARQKPLYVVEACQYQQN